MTATRKGVAEATIRQRRKTIRPMLVAISEEGISLREACRRAKRSITTTRAWIEADADLAAHYARAREDRADLLHERMLEIASTPMPGEITTSGSRDGKAFDETKRADMTEHRRLQVETIKWVLGRMHSNRFGDVTKIEQSGPQGGPIAVNATVTHEVSDRLAKGLAALRAKLPA